MGVLLFIASKAKSESKRTVYAQEGLVKWVSTDELSELSALSPLQEVIWRLNWKPEFQNPHSLCYWKWTTKNIFIFWLFGVSGDKTCSFLISYTAVEKMAFSWCLVHRSAIKKIKLPGFMKNSHLGQELSMVNVLKQSFPKEDKVKQSKVHKKVEEISDRFYWQLHFQRQNIAFVYLCISKVVLLVDPSILLWILISSFFFFF